VGVERIHDVSPNDSRRWAGRPGTTGSRQLAPGDAVRRPPTNFGATGKADAPILVSPAVPQPPRAGTLSSPADLPTAAIVRGDVMDASTPTPGSASRCADRMSTPTRYSAVYLKRVTRTGFEDGLFAAWRADPSFILNLPPFDKGSVLVAGPDFGTGSSREHAVWALMDFGSGS